MKSSLLSAFLLLAGTTTEVPDGEQIQAERRIKALEEKMEGLEARLTNLEDIEEIKQLQRIYGYYIDNKLWDQVVDLFTDNNSSIEIGGRGVYRNRKGVNVFFLNVLGKGRYGRLPGELYNHMQLQGVVHVECNGKTAKARWRAFAQAATDSSAGKIANWGEGVYENEYIKEDGKWKFKKMH
jgi:hypothetical protein